MSKGADRRCATASAVNSATILAASSTSVRCKLVVNPVTIRFSRLALVNVDRQIGVEPRVLVRAVFRVATRIADDPRSIDQIVKGVVGVPVNP